MTVHNEWQFNYTANTAYTVKFSYVSKISPEFVKF